MKKMIPVAALAISVAIGAGACKKKSKSGAKATSSFHSTAALWKLAPKNIALAVVVADGAGKTLAHALAEAARVARAQPLGAKLFGKFDRELTAQLGVDPFDPKAWSKIGIGPGKGAALFFTPHREGILVLPVTDAAAFRKFVHAKTKKVGGVTYDHFSDTYCRPTKGRYICSDSTEEIAATGDGAGGPLPTFVAKLPKKLRGDVEIVANLRRFPDAIHSLRALAPALTDIKHIVVSARVGGGRLSVRGWLEGTRGGPIGQLFANVPKPGAASKAIAGADGVLAARIPQKLLEPAIAGAPSMPGIDAKALLRDLTGEFVAVSKGSGAFSGQMAAGISNAAQVKAAIGVACTGIASVNPALGATLKKNGACVGKLALPPSLPASVVPAAKRLNGTPVELSVKDDALVMSVGRVPAPAGKRGDAAGGPATREILTGDWQAMMWARSLDPLAGLSPSDAKAIDSMVKARASARLAGVFLLVRWLTAHLYDAGVAASLRADGIHVLVAADTFAADPPTVYNQYEAAVKKSLAGDFAGYRSALGAIAKKHPHSLAGRQARAVAAGVPAFGPGGTMVLGVAAAIAIPAYMKYLKRSEAAAAPTMPPATP